MSRSPITRRQALKVLAGSGAWLVLNGCEAGTGSPASGAASRALDGAVALEEAARDLELNMWAEPTTAQIIPGLDTAVLSFGAEVVSGDPASITPGPSFLGPTLHLRTGQRVRVHFENRIDEESIIHWHGLVVPQLQDGQPAEAVGPGETYEYDFVVENDPGTYWYHPHPHQLTGPQVYRGLAGLLIVHGDEHVLPDGTGDLALVLQDRSIADDGSLRYVSTMHDAMAGFVGETLVTNGVADCRVMVDRSSYRVRMLNGSNSRTQFLTMSTGDPLLVLATDGSLQPEALEVPGIVLTPAQRTDIWLDFSRFDPGTEIQLLAADTFVESMGMMGGGMMGGSEEFPLSLDGRVAATFVVGDTDPLALDPPTTLSDEPDFAPEDAVNLDSPKEFELATFRASHWINGTRWEGREVTDLERVRADTVELWEFINRSPMAHPMHLHGRAFRVVSRSWDDESIVDAWEAIAPGVVDSGVRDTVLVWPGQRVQLAVPFSSHKGYFLYHCHVLEHEDGGMMRSFLVE